MYAAPTAAGMPPGPASAPPNTLPPAAPPPRGLPASTGFQMNLRLGLSVPLGLATTEPGDSLARRYAWQLPFEVGVGFKPNPNIYLGGYLTFGLGGEGSEEQMAAYCDDDDADLENDIACTALSLRAGIEGQYHFKPAGEVNPWVGYGIGFEAVDASVSDTNSGYSEATYTSGITWAKLQVGVDFRGDPLGVAPFMEGAVGRYTSARTEINGVETFSGDLDDPGFHAWLTFGARLVFFP